MSDARRQTGGDNEDMTEYEFTCPECSQQIAVNENVREAIIANGCPVCTAQIEPTEFTEA